MKRFWKWFLIVVGILVLIGIAFVVAMLFFRAGNLGFARFGAGRMGAFGLRRGFFGGMMGGMGLMMLFRGLIPLGVLVLAGFGVVYLVKNGKSNRQQPTLPVAQQVCGGCGKPLAAEWNTCPYCGKKVEKSEDKSAEKPKA